MNNIKVSLAEIELLLKKYPILENNRQSLYDAVKILIKVFNNGNKLLICGNGGSAADSIHIVGELMKGFVLQRKITSEICDKIYNKCVDAQFFIDNLQMGLPAISLVNEIALNTAFANDNTPSLIFAQQVLVYGKKGDVFLGISTSGNSKNVVYASQLARALDMSVITLTGMSGGKLKELSDVCINVNEQETYRVQELHLPVYHTICLALEKYFFGGI